MGGNATRRGDAPRPQARTYSAPVPTACMISFRLGGGDGVSVEAAKWADALDRLGWDVRTVAGAGPVDTVLPGLAIEAPEPPTRPEGEAALAPGDLVVVENLCSLPLTPGAADLVAAVCAGRPALLHHHDLPWQRPHLAGRPPPPDDPSWAHVTINELSRRDLAGRGITATTIYNTFDPDPFPGDRRGTRDELGVREATALLLQPTRALPRKNVEGALALAEAGSPGPVAASPTRTRRATPCCCPPPGRGSAPRRSSRPRTGGRSPSAPIRWRPSWPRSASAGSTRRTRRPSAPSSRRPTAPSSSTTTRWRPSTSTGPTCRGGWPGCSSGSPASDPIGGEPVTEARVTVR